MRKFKKILFLFVAIILFISPMQVQASKKKDVKQITRQVNSYMTAVKSYDKKKIQSCLIDKNFSYWNTYPKMQKYVRLINKRHLSYNINSIKTKGNTAKAIIKVSFYNSYDVSARAMKNVIPEFKKSWSSKKLINRYYHYLREEYDSDYYYTDETTDFISNNIFITKTTIPLRKINGKWKIEKVNTLMQYQMDSETSRFLIDFAKNPLFVYEY